MGKFANNQLPVRLASGVCWTPCLFGIKKTRFEEEVLQKLGRCLLYE